MYVRAENSYCQLHKEDYILDVSTTLSRRKKTFYFLFQRTSWVCPLHAGGSDVYFEMMYNQVRVQPGSSVCCCRRHSNSLLLGSSKLTCVCVCVQCLPDYVDGFLLTHPAPYVSKQQKVCVTITTDV